MDLELALSIMGWCRLQQTGRDFSSWRFGLPSWLSLLEDAIDYLCLENKYALILFKSSCINHLKRFLHQGVPENVEKNRKTIINLSLLKELSWTHHGGLLGHNHSSIGMYDKMECSCAMAAISLRNSVKRTVAKTSVRSKEMALGLGGGELFKSLPASPWVECLLPLLSENTRIY